MLQVVVVVVLGGGSYAYPKIYAVINLPLIHNKNGLGWIFVAGINMIAEAIKLGYIPIVDMQHHDNQYFKDGRKFKDNVWEYYFKQPCDINLNDISKIENNELIRVFTQPYLQVDEYGAKNIPMRWFSTKREADNFVYKEIIKQTLKLSNEMQSYIVKNNVIEKDEKVLGILCRGTDYIYRRPFGHTIPAKPYMLIKEAKELKKRFDYTKIYVATEDLEIYNEFKKVFGNMMIPNTQYMYKRYEKADLLLAEVKVERQNHNYLLGMEYLASMYMLSKCKYLIASNNCTGLNFVSVFSNFYKDMEYVHIWDRGKYGVSKKVKYNNIFERIFSVKNEQNEDIVRKVITLFGIKIKLKKKTI